MRAFIAVISVAAARAATGNYVDGACADAAATGSLFPSQCDSGAQFTETVDVDYSLLWQVSYPTDTYKIVTNSPMAANAPTHHVLYQCGTTPPTQEELPAYAAGAKIMPVPITEAGTTSTTYLPLIEMVNERASLKAYSSSFDYVTSPCLRRLFLQGQIQENVATTEAWGNMTVFASQWGGSATSAPGFVEMSDIRERMPHAVLKTAEYVEYVGLFYNREKEAKAAITHIVENWLCSKDVVAEVVAEHGGEPVKVAWLSYYGGWQASNPDCCGGETGGWNVPSTGTWVEEIIEAAGGRMVIPGADVVPARSGPWGYSYLSDQQVVDVFAEADVVLFVGAWDDAAEPFASVQELNAVKNQKVFDNQGPRGSADWFERRTVEPDAVLQDFALAFYPDDAHLAGLTHKWMRNVYTMPAGTRPDDSELEALCPDVTAPYVFDSTYMCTTPQPTPQPHSSSSKKKKSSSSGLGTVGIVLIVIACAIVVATIGLFVGMQSRKSASKSTEGVKVVDEEVEVKTLEGP